MSIQFLALTYVQAVLLLVCLLFTFRSNTTNEGLHNVWVSRIFLASLIVSLSKGWGLW